MSSFKAPCLPLLTPVLVKDSITRTVH